MIIDGVENGSNLCSEHAVGSFFTHQSKFVSNDSTQHNSSIMKFIFACQSNTPRKIIIGFSLFLSNGWYERSKPLTQNTNFSKLKKNQRYFNNRFLNVDIISFWIIIKWSEYDIFDGSIKWVRRSCLINSFNCIKFFEKSCSSILQMNLKK